MELSCLDPGRCCALPEVALVLLLQHSISVPSFLCCTWERDPFLDLSCVAFITAFVVCVHLCHALFCKPVFVLLRGCLAVFNCTTLLWHRIGLSLQWDFITISNTSQCPTFLCDFVKCFPSKVKSCRHDSGLSI